MDMVIRTKTLKLMSVDSLSSLRHGSPEDRGGADRYYGREYAPHYYVGDSYKSECIQGSKLTAEDREAYEKGWKGQIDRKDWG